MRSWDGSLEKDIPRRSLIGVTRAWMASGKVPAKIVLREYLESLIVAVVVALILRLFVVSAYKIPTGSMVPTLKAGDFIFAYKLPYGVPVPFTGQKLAVRAPSRGDVVVFRPPGNESVNYIKRVIGFPGEKIEIRKRQLFINDKEAIYEALGEKQIADLPGHEYFSVYKEQLQGSTHLVINRNGDDPGFFGPIIVPPGHIFVLGDNRDSSDDSRVWGSIPLKNLEGKVLLVWLSLDWLDRWGNDRFPRVRWERVFHVVR